MKYQKDFDETSKFRMAVYEAINLKLKGAKLNDSLVSEFHFNYYDFKFAIICDINPAHKRHLFSLYKKKRDEKTLKEDAFEKIEVCSSYLGYIDFQGGVLLSIRFQDDNMENLIDDLSRFARNFIERIDDYLSKC